MDVSRLMVQLAVTAALAGLCWTAQLTVYAHFGRLLKATGAEEFRRYHEAYTTSMGWIAAPLMLAELALAGGWLLAEPASVAARAGAAAVGLLWVQTFAQMVPLHARLQRAPEEALTRRLTRWNWVRTLLWTARTAGLVALAQS